MYNVKYKAWKIERENTRILESGNIPVEHSIERRNFIHPHGRHLQELRNVVHHTDTRPSLVLSLRKVQKRNRCSFLVLRRVVRDNLLCPLEVLGVEFEWDLMS